MPSVRETEKQLQRAVAERVQSSLPGVEVLAVELSGPEHFTVFVDRSEGGVDLALCRQVTDVLRDYLRDFQVDVSSPGVERPVRTPAHFRQALGRRVTLRTPERKRLRGEIVVAGDEAVTVRTDSEDIQIPYETIVRGNLIEE